MAVPGQEVDNPPVTGRVPSIVAAVRCARRLRCRHLVRLVTFAALALAVSACRADVDIEVTVQEDGSGIVETTTTLDAETSAALLDLERGADGLPLSDLAQSGWVVGRPERNADGSTVITASKEFGTAAQFSEVMADLTGDTGAIRNFRLFRTKSFARVDYRITGALDTSKGLDGLADPALVAALGTSVSDIAQGYGAEAGDVGMTLQIVLPGEISGEPPTGVIDAGANEVRATWRVSFGDPDFTAVELRSATRQVSLQVLRGVAVVSAVLAGLVVFAQLLRILLPDRRRRAARRQPSPARRPPETTGEHPAVTGEPQPARSDDTEPSEARSPYRVIALDGMGVLYRQGDDVSTVLVPFAHERGSVRSAEEIEAKARQLELGRITTGEFWSAIGVPGDAAALDGDYQTRLQLSPGVVKYLRRLRGRGVRVAWFANEATEWVNRLKAANNLEGLIEVWVTSGAVGVRKPDKPIFEVLRRLTGEPPSKILVVDDDLEILDAARDLGFATAWFTAEGDEEQANDHVIIRNFEAADARVGLLERSP